MNDETLACIRILCDFIPKSVKLDAIHLVAETAYSQGSVIKRAIKIVEADLCNNLTLMDEQIVGYPGGEAWKKELHGLCSSLSRIYPITITKIPFPIIEGVMASNSYGEAIAVVTEAEKEGWEHIGIIAQPLHQIRSFLGFVKVRERIFPELKVYSIVGESLAWTEHVIHSQGVETGKRASLLIGECKRIIKYQGFGHLATFQEAIEYLNWRDGIE